MHDTFDLSLSQPQWQDASSVQIPNFNGSYFQDNLKLSSSRINFVNAANDYLDSGIFGNKKAKQNMYAAGQQYNQTIQDLQSQPGIENNIPNINLISSGTIKSEIDKTIDKKGEDRAAQFEDLSKKYSKSIGTGFDIASSLIGDNRDVQNGPKGNITNTLDSGYNMASDAMLQSGNPYAMAAGAAMKGMGMINQAIGHSTDGMTGLDASLDSNLGFLLTGGLSKLNASTGNTTDTFQVDNEIKANMGSAYASTYESLDSAAAKAGKRYGGLSNGKYKQAQLDIAKAKTDQDTMDQINTIQTDRTAASTYQGIGFRNTNALNGGFQSLRAAKQGMKLNIDFARQACHKLHVIVDNYYRNQHVAEDSDNSQQVEYLKSGGSFNVIPEGALHKNKHNMEDAEGLTKKGIPVVTEEDGKKVQQAEIEVNEIIFRLEVTEKLEELAKQNTDEAAIEAGKLIAKEILHNTHDNTGLIDQC